MDVRGSLNAESNLSVVTGEGERSFLDNVSFIDMVPPQAASTVGRSKSRRFMQDSDMGSFLDDMPMRSPSPLDIQPINVTQPKVRKQQPPGNRPQEQRNGGEQFGQNMDWSVVNAWCRDNKSDIDKTSQDDRSSMGIINIDDMDFSTNNLLLEAPLDELRRTDREQETSGSIGGSIVQKSASGNSTLKNNTPSDSFPWRHDGSSSNSSQDTKQDQPFARSQIGTVKKMIDKPKSADPITAAIRQSLFGQMTIGEEGEEKDTSVYQVELQAEELNEIDNEFGEMDLSGDSEGEEAKTPVNKHLPKISMSTLGDEIRIDSIYFRPGMTVDESQPSQSLPFLSKVSLFEGGSGSEIDTEDELEQARKEQGARHEAAGEASYQDTSRPGLEGDCSDDHSGEKRLPITQRQSAEGDVVSSPVPGDGGGGGDGSSGSESDDGRGSRATSGGLGSVGYASNLPSNRQSQTREQEEQRIRPMGDDLLSEMRFSRYQAPTNQEQDDTRLHSRYLARISPVEDTNPESVLMDHFDFSQNQTGEDENFNPGNRLEASGYNADDLSAQGLKKDNSNPFGQFNSSWGSYGLDPGPDSANQSQGQGPSHFDSGLQIEPIAVELMANRSRNVSDEKGYRSSAERSWTQMVASNGSSKQNSLGSEPRTSGDVGLSLPGFEQADYARLGSEERGSLGRSSGSGSLSSRSTGQRMIGQSNIGSSVTQASSSGVDLNQSNSRFCSKGELKESGIFKKPFLPAPKAAGVFTKSVSKPKTSQSGSHHCSSGQSSTSSVRSNMGEFENDLAFRLSLTKEAHEQQSFLKRVPSLGETNTMDMTVNDEDFFGNADALAMLDQDENDFVNEHVFRQDDAMVDTSVGNDWAFKSIMSVARPSWIQDLPSNEKNDVVRISVGTYIGGRTLALGSLGDDVDCPRPDFGMSITSPKKDEDVFEGARTSGVGEYDTVANIRSAAPKPSQGESHRLHKRLDSEDVKDDTMTMDSIQNLSGAPSRSRNTFSSDISAFIRGSFDAPALSTMIKTGGAKKTMKNPSGNQSASPTKSSQLPLRKGSNLSQNFKNNGRGQNIGSSIENIVPNSEVMYERSSLKEEKTGDPDKTKSPLSSGDRVSLELTRPDEILDDVWSSPNTSKFMVRESGLFDRMDDFQFSQQGGHSPEKKNLNHHRSNDIKETLKAQYSLSGFPGQNLHKDREKTPPPDGEDRAGSRTSGPQQSLFNKQDLLDSGKDSSHARIQINQRDRTLPGVDPRRDKSQITLESSRLNTSANDHGYMPGHHIPDGTAYSQRSDFCHMDHKGMSREDVAGVDDIGLAESRGFDMLKGKRGFLPSTGSRDSYSQSAETKQSLDRHTRNIQQYYKEPVQGLDSTEKDVTNHHGLEHSKRTDRMRNEETQSRNDLDQLESWTQTSQVLQESVGLHTGPDALPNSSINPEISSLNQAEDGEFATLNSVSFNMTDNMKSKHYFEDNMHPSEPEKLHLLTKKTSLMKTQFAQENLKRDFGVDVMDKIYSNKPIRNTEQDYQAVSNNIDTRFSIDSVADWTEVHRLKTMDASQLSEGDISSLNHLRFHNQMPPVQSTPMHLGNGYMQISQYSMTSQLPAGDGHLSTGRLSVSDGLIFKTPARPTVCPVESPGVLKFKEECCVGISKKEVLPLKNPTDRWMECIIEVHSLVIDGRPARMEFFPFELRQKKIIIDPHKVENVDIMFLPKIPGAYVAQVQIYSRAFTKLDERSKDSIPINVTFQAIAEDPWIKVECEDNHSDVLDFGEMVWGSCREKTICLKNMGYATVPLRLAVSSTRGWHCFSFEPEGRMSDVSVISGIHVPQSGQGKTIINVSLPGSKDSFNYHTVKIWCRPPAKQYTKTMARQPAEQFSCNVDVEVDIPCSKFSKLASLRMKAVVGIQKLHMQSNLKEIHLKAAPNGCTESTVRLFNAGNLGLNILLGFSEHGDVFSVDEPNLNINPGVDAEVKVSFKPKDNKTPRFMSLLLMMVKPDGPMFELCMQGDVIQKKTVPKILCDCMDMDFGGVAIGKAVVKRSRLMNQGEATLSLTAESRVDDITLLMSQSSTSVGQKKIELHIRPGETLPVYVRYAPSKPVSVTGKIVMRPVNDNTKYFVKLHGYGGVSKLWCSEECTVPASIQSHPCVSLDPSGSLKEIYIRNIGVQTAQVKGAFFTDFQCSQKMIAGQIIVQPSEFKLETQQKTILELVTRLSESELESKCDENGLLAVLRLQFKDIVDSSKPYISNLIIGIVKNKQERTQLRSSFRTPVKCRLAPESNISQPLTDTTSFRTVDNTNTVSSDVSGFDVWNVKPQDMVLYCTRKGKNDQMRQFNIFNNYKTDLSFEISWPGDMLSLIPGRGVVKPRESAVIQIFPSTKSSNHQDLLPWTGKVAIMANDALKFVKVQLRQDSSGDNNEPVEDDTQLMPVTTNKIQSGSSFNKLGDLEVSTTQVVFSKTAAGKTTEESLWLKNVGPDMLRYMFSSFASPYLEKTADKTKEMFRVSYKVFDFSSQFSKLNGHEALQLTVQFMPRSSGMFSQYWDLQTTGNSGSYNKAHRQEYIRIHFIGEGFEEQEPQSSKLSSLTKNLLQSFPSEHKKLILCDDKMIFPVSKPGESRQQKVELKNQSGEEIKTEVMEPQPPFYIKHQRFKIIKRRYLRFPVEFRPDRPGKFSDKVKFHSSQGETLILHLEGECC